MPQQPAAGACRQTLVPCHLVIGPAEKQAVKAQLGGHQARLQQRRGWACDVQNVAGCCPSARAAALAPTWVDEWPKGSICQPTVGTPLAPKAERKKRWPSVVWSTMAT